MTDTTSINGNQGFPCELPSNQGDSSSEIQELEQAVQSLLSALEGQNSPSPQMNNFSTGGSNGMPCDFGSSMPGNSGAWPSGAGMQTPSWPPMGGGMQDSSWPPMGCETPNPSSAWGSPAGGGMQTPSWPPMGGGMQDPSSAWGSPAGGGMQTPSWPPMGIGLEQPPSSGPQVTGNLAQDMQTLQSMVSDPSTDSNALLRFAESVSEEATVQGDSADAGIANGIATSLLSANPPASGTPAPTTDAPATPDASGMPPATPDASTTPPVTTDPSATPSSTTSDPSATPSASAPSTNGNASAADQNFLTTDQSAYEQFESDVTSGNKKGVVHDLQTAINNGDLSKADAATLISETGMNFHAGVSKGTETGTSSGADLIAAQDYHGQKVGQGIAFDPKKDRGIANFSS